jgi:peptidoglycan-associated lipoprotein
MKKALTLTVAAILLLAAPMNSQAHEYDRDDSDHPLRLLAYVAYPFGIAVEYLILRPIHCFVSENKFRNELFGHDSFGKPCGHADGDSAGAPGDYTGLEGQSVTFAAEEPQEIPGSDDRAPITGLRPIENLHTIYFDFDRDAIRDDQVGRVQHNLTYLKENPSLRVVIEGHCDERGTVEYNYNLGERRARSVREYLVKNGIDPARLMIISKGEEAPADPGKTEEAYAKNRRVQFDEPL